MEELNKKIRLEKARFDEERRRLEGFDSDMRGRWWCFDPIIKISVKFPRALPTLVFTIIPLTLVKLAFDDYIPIWIATLLFMLSLGVGFFVTIGSQHSRELEILKVRYHARIKDIEDERDRLLDGVL
jgi:hypothetical protein